MQNHVIYDDAVVGAGIVGLAHAYHLARRNRKVVVVERARADRTELWFELGALRFVDQPPGERFALAMKSRTHWLKVCEQAGLWQEMPGSLLAVYDEDELQTLQEFVELATAARTDVELLSREAALLRSPWLQEKGLLGALWCPHDGCVDPRQVAYALPAWLTEKFGVQFVYETGAARIESQTLHTTKTPVYARHFWICSDAEFAQLFPDAFRESGLFCCRTQRLRTKAQPDSPRMGPLLATGPTLLQAPAFAEVPALSAVRARCERESPELMRLGIQALATQLGPGDVAIGDSREFGENLDTPFLNGEIEQLTLEALVRLVDLPNGNVAQRWATTYWKHSYEPWYVARPAENITIVAALGEAAMPLSFGLADQLIHEKMFDAERIDLIVFNMEGTAIVDSNGVAACMRDAFFDFGMQVQLNQINQVMGWPKPAAIRHLVDTSHQHAERLRDQIALIHANFVTRMKRYYMHDPRVQVAPGAADLFRDLRARGMKVAFNSGFNRELTQTILHRFGWKVGDVYDAVISSDEVSRGRPFPDMVNELMKRVGVSKSRHVAKVGDSPADIEEGVNAGCGLVVGIASGSYKADDLRHYRPHQVLEKLKDLPQVLPQPEEVEVV
jgi:D-hydroxyproline dehydrogenase subunit beta